MTDAFEICYEKFDICHCGNVDKPHYFRHPYQRVTTVCRIRCRDSSAYRLLAGDFPVQDGTRCIAGNCVALPAVHNTPTLPHMYVPQAYTYREVKFTLPLNAVCTNCHQELKDHKEGHQSHIFSVKLDIIGLNDTDVVTIVHPDDEDIKVRWEKLI